MVTRQQVTNVGKQREDSELERINVLKVETVYKNHDEITNTASHSPKQTTSTSSSVELNSDHKKHNNNTCSHNTEQNNKRNENTPHCNDHCKRGDKAHLKAMILH